MTIDLNSCTGCSACVAAATRRTMSGRRQGSVADGRIMSWIRIERYLPERNGSGRGAAALPRADAVPAMRSRAVRAGLPGIRRRTHRRRLNAQIYNRCVGTRYCENNCPYKVRRFNWYEPEWPEPLNLQLNPDVTVRGAGVMEKCTFCVQRIQLAEIDAKIEDRKLRDGEIVTACAAGLSDPGDHFRRHERSDSAMMKRRDGQQAAQLHARWRSSIRCPRSLTCAISIARKESLSGCGAENQHSNRLTATSTAACMRVMEPAGLEYWAVGRFCVLLVGIGGRAAGPAKSTRAWA